MIEHHGGAAGEERAIAPVIGVILLVSITVIVAAVTGVFLVSVGEQMGQPTPQAILAISAADDHALLIEHDGGDSFEAAETTMYVNGEPVTDASGSYTGTIEPGETVVFRNASRLDFGDGHVDTVKLMYDPTGHMLAQSTIER